MSAQFRPWMVIVTSFVSALGVMLTFTSALPWCLVATTHRFVVHAEGRFYGFCLASCYIRIKLHPVKVSLLFLLLLLKLIYYAALPQLDAGPIGGAGNHVRG
jgi:hypothetical protein